MLRLALALALTLAACTRGVATDGAIDADERTALLAVLAEAGVDPARIALEHDLFAVPWRGAEDYAYRNGRADRIEDIRRTKDDARDAVAVEGGRVVALRIGHTKLVSLASIAKLTHLVLLDVHDSPLADPSGAASLPALDHLALSGDTLTSTEGLAGVSSVHTLYLTDNRIEHLDGLAAMTGLDVLNAAGNRIAKIEGLERFPKLRVLSLASNPITRIEGFETSSALLELNLSYCQIAKIENLGGASHLRSLQLWRNRITDPTPVLAMPPLVHLGIGENPIDWGSPGFREFERKSRVELLATGL